MHLVIDVTHFAADGGLEALMPNIELSYPLANCGELLFMLIKLSSLKVDDSLKRNRVR